VGRHRQPRRAGLSPVLSGAAIVAVLVTVGVLIQPQAAPDAALVLPAPSPAVGATTSAPAPTTTPAPTTSVKPTAPKVTVKPAPVTSKPSRSTKPPKVAAPAPAAKAAPVGVNPKCHSIGVKVQVVKACDQITAAVPGITVIGGVGSRPGNPTSCHPLGLALDLMTYKDKALGDRIYAYAKAHKAELGLTTLLWQVAGHYDHVHVSALPCLH
jgi:hypothetical protein